MKTMICAFVGCQLHISRQNLHIWRRHVCFLAVDVFFKICTFEGAVFAQMWLFAHLKAKCLHKFGCLHIWRRNVCTNVVVCTFEGELFAQMWLILDENNYLHIILWDVCTFHVKIEPLHIWRRHVCTVVDVFFLNTDLHIWGRRVCTNVVVCTFEGKMFAQM